eukprot:6089349-Alexandrium_andersonii.AAC.1
MAFRRNPERPPPTTQKATPRTAHRNSEGKKPAKRGAAPLVLHRSSEAPPPQKHSEAQRAPPPARPEAL